MYTLTKMDVAAIRACDSISVRLSATDQNSVYLTKDKQRTERDPFACDVQHYMDAPVSVRVYRSEDTTHASAWGHARLYKGQRCEARSILATLRVGDAISFEFCAGGHSTDAMVDAGIHGDFLRIVIRRKGQTDYANDDTFTLASRVGTTGHRMVTGLIPRVEKVTA
jgi:hypothetical protein